MKIEIIPQQQDSIYVNSIVTLFKEYQLELGEDLCFQSFDEELSNPFKKYAPPIGAILLAKLDHQIAGCVALQSLPDGSCEMKRLYVKPEYRKFHIGAALVEAVLKEAKLIGYTIMKLDTLQRLQPAIKLYEKYGFKEVTAYYENPLPNVVYMEKEL